MDDLPSFTKIDHESSLGKINSSNKLVANTNYIKAIIENDDDSLHIDHMEKIIEYKYGMQIERPEYARLATRNHLIFEGSFNGACSYFIVTKSDAGYSGYVLSSHGPSSFLIVSQYDPELEQRCTQSLISPKNGALSEIKMIEKKLEGKYAGYKFRLITDNIIKKLIDFESNFICTIKKIIIGITYFDGNNETPMKMLESPSRITGQIFGFISYYKFLKILGIDPSNDPNDTFDIYRGIKIIWLDALKMEDQYIRQHIGNVNFLIIYNGSTGSITTKSLGVFGKMVHHFLVVSKVYEELFHISFAGKIPQFPPIVPPNVIFNESNLRDFIIIKAYNAAVQSKYNPSSPVSKLHTIPAQEKLNEISLDSKKDIKKTQ